MQKKAGMKNYGKSNSMDYGSGDHSSKEKMMEEGMHEGKEYQMGMGKVKKKKKKAKKKKSRKFKSIAELREYAKKYS